ncbi:pistil-specific extensin-like protein [Macadamia integrifolia]|uniref:pistil-specific extensin-like protein n=1 Tax=Macadamia integrifolia TaxID=60698 RepID=UPI001C4FB821|nr:pistil-specific extensin-like protein [Macadamia integrifolia]
MKTKKMAVALIIAASLLMGCLNVSEAWKEKPSVIHVGGKVLCQDCSKGYNEWVKGAKPIKGCRVSITCLDERHRVAYYGSDETDDEGQFELIISKIHSNGKSLYTEGCSVRLVSSPDPSCNVFTDFGGGRSGVKLHRPTSVYRDLIKYIISPLYFTTPMCDEPHVNY